MKIRRIACFMLAGLLLSAGCVINVGGWNLWAKYERTVELQHGLRPGSTLEVTTSSGSINVEGIQTDECRVQAHIEVRAGSDDRAQQIADEIEILIQPTVTGLEIKAEYPRVHGVSVSISYDVIVPRQTTVTCRCSSGSVKVVGTEGRVDARSSSGSVRGEQLSGDRAVLHTSSGSVYLRQARFEACDLHTASGSIHGDNVDCKDIKARVSSGSISIVCKESVSPELTADLSTSSGSVNLSVPQTFQGRVELSTSSGSVDTALPVTVQGKISQRHLVGTVGTGSGYIRLKTSSGSVRLKTIQ